MSGRKRHGTWWLWLVLAVAELLVGAYLGDTYGWGPVILATVLAVLFAAFHRSRQHTRRQYRH